MQFSKSRLAFFVVSLLFIITIYGCSSTDISSSQGTFPVDSAFSDYYRELGGEEILGPAISPVFSKDGVTYQYLVSGLMTYDPSKVAVKRYFFAPIASSEWHINGQVEPVPVNSDAVYVNGHQIWDEVEPIYNQYGPDIIGLPLTGVKVNDAKQRYEQYFEGLGFYRKYSDPPGQIHLMPYGDWMCGSNCQYASVDSVPPTTSYSRVYSATEQIFLDESEQLGYGFTGKPLEAPRLGSDGNYEMVFENVIMYIDPANDHEVQLRPVPTWLGIQPDPLGAEDPADGLTFYPIQDGVGYNVPDAFTEYINNHGTITFSGNPITEHHTLPDGGYSQCFTNMCLEYHPAAPEGLEIRLHTLGLDYLFSGTKSDTTQSTFSDALQINTREANPLIPSGQRQVITIEAQQSGQPVSGIQVSVVVTQPDGITKTYTLAPTGEDGITSVELDPIDGPNGSIVQYEVCVVNTAAPQVCFLRSYSIWDQ